MCTYLYTHICVCMIIYYLDNISQYNLENFSKKGDLTRTFYYNHKNPNRTNGRKKNILTKKCNYNK